MLVWILCLKRWSGVIISLRFKKVRRSLLLSRSKSLSLRRSSCWIEYLIVYNFYYLGNSSKNSSRDSVLLSGTYLFLSKLVSLISTKLSPLITFSFLLCFFNSFSMHFRIYFASKILIPSINFYPLISVSSLFNIKSGIKLSSIYSLKIGFERP